MRPFDDAIEAREAVEAVHGKAEDWRPPVDGVVPADRMEAFLAVRVELMEHCAGFTETFEQFERMDQLGEDPPARTVIKELMGTVGAAMGMAGKIGKFNKTRNEILLAHGMGLGEYTYIFSVGYLSWLGIDLEDSHLEVGGEEASPRVRKLLRGMLAGQYEDAQAAGRPEQELARLRDELTRLTEDRRSYPWQEGVPPAIAACFEPYRAELEETYCEGMAPFELVIMKKGNRGFSYQSD
jgi:hypothetical protein